MGCYESITEKLKQYLINNKGFSEENGTLTKTLTKKEDMIYAKDLFKRIASGMIPYGMKFAYGTMEDNYRSIIEENFEDWIELTDEERDYLCGHQLYDEDEASDDDEDTGWDYVDQWILDNVEVIADRSVVDEMAKEEMGKV